VSPLAAPGSQSRYILSVDVEDYFQVETFSDRIHREDWQAMPQRVEASTQRVLPCEIDPGHRASPAGRVSGCGTTRALQE
jgi:hypothetical protein